MTRPLVLAILFAASMIATAPAQAKTKPAKAPQAQKERLVLMPLRVGNEIQNMQGAMETAIAQGLQQQYTVFSGEDVAKKTREIFKKESSKQNCDETKCMENVAIAFQSELVAVASVAKVEGGYLLALNIRNVFDNKAVYNNSLPCKGCDAFAVVEKLKELVGTHSSVSAVPAEPEAPKINLNDPEGALWSEAQKGNSVEDYQVYLDSYPKGKYVPLAKARIKKLKDAAQAAAEQQEQGAWDTAQQENSEASYALYLKGYPTGRYAGLAKVRMDKLKNDIAAKEEADLWKKAESGMDRAAVESYLNQYPTGRYIAAASVKLQAIKEEEAKGPAMVKIPGRNYELGKYEVTQKEWQAVMGNNPSRFTFCGESCPVEQVSWSDIQTFIQKLNAKTGRQYRLPTEAEWEYACYGGSQTEYCGGNDIDAVAWYGNNGEPGGNSNQTTHPVGQKQANGYGLYDMSGNVWEWLENKYDTVQRALRGGSWLNGSQNVRAALRNWSEPSFRSKGLGFRLARTLP